MKSVTVSKVQTQIPQKTSKHKYDVTYTFQKIVPLVLFAALTLFAYAKYLQYFSAPIPNHIQVYSSPYLNLYEDTLNMKHDSVTTDKLQALPQSSSPYSNWNVLIPVMYAAYSLIFPFISYYLFDATPHTTTPYTITLYTTPYFQHHNTPSNDSVIVDKRIDAETIHTNTNGHSPALEHPSPKTPLSHSTPERLPQTKTNTIPTSSHVSTPSHTSSHVPTPSLASPYAPPPPSSHAQSFLEPQKGSTNKIFIESQDDDDIEYYSEISSIQGNITNMGSDILETSSSRHNNKPLSPHGSTNSPSPSIPNGHSSSPNGHPSTPNNYSPSSTLPSTANPSSTPNGNPSTPNTHSSTPNSHSSTPKGYSSAKGYSSHPPPTHSPYQPSINHSSPTHLPSSAHHPPPRTPGHTPVTPNYNNYNSPNTHNKTSSPTHPTTPYTLPSSSSHLPPPTHPTTSYTPSSTSHPVSPSPSHQLPPTSPHTSNGKQPRHAQSRPSMPSQHSSPVAHAHASPIAQTHPRGQNYTQVTQSQYQTIITTTKLNGSLTRPEEELDDEADGTLIGEKDVSMTISSLSSSTTTSFRSPTNAKSPHPSAPQETSSLEISSNTSAYSSPNTSRAPSAPPPSDPHKPSPSPNPPSYSPHYSPSPSSSSPSPSPAYHSPSPSSFSQKSNKKPEPYQHYYDNNYTTLTPVPFASPHPPSQPTKSKPTTDDVTTPVRNARPSPSPSPSSVASTPSPAPKFSRNYDSFSDSHIMFSPMSEIGSDDDDTGDYTEVSAMDDVSITQELSFASRKFLENHGLMSPSKNR